MLMVLCDGSFGAAFVRSTLGSQSIHSVFHAYLRSPTLMHCCGSERPRFGNRQSIPPSHDVCNPPAGGIVHTSDGSDPQNRTDQIPKSDRSDPRIGQIRSAHRTDQICTWNISRIRSTHRIDQIAAHRTDQTPKADRSDTQIG